MNLPTLEEKKRKNRLDSNIQFNKHNGDDRQKRPDRTVRHRIKKLQGTQE